MVPVFLRSILGEIQKKSWLNEAKYELFLIKKSENRKQNRKKYTKK